ncbi:MAG: M15 family metallopeptidase [Patescibacteria group bacterium]
MRKTIKIDIFFFLLVLGLAVFLFPPPIHAQEVIIDPDYGVLKACDPPTMDYYPVSCVNNLCGDKYTEKIVCDCAASYCCLQSDPVKSQIFCIAKGQPAAETLGVGKITLQQPLPGFEGAKEVTGNTIGEYISAFYRYFAAAAGILATVMILFSGFQWVTASGNASRIEKAKSTMNGALIGLVLTLTAYVLLYAINPGLVKWSTISLNIIPRELLEKEAISISQCPTDSEMVKISDYINKDYIEISSRCSGDCQIRSQVIPMLDKAAKELIKQNMKIVVMSAWRPLELQQKLYDCYEQYKGLGCSEECKKIGNCSPAAKPSCESPHVSGLAVDLCYKIGNDDSSCTKLSTINNAPMSSPDYGPQTILQKVMQKAGFYRYCGEWWHFEAIRISTPCPPGVYNTPSL